MIEITIPKLGLTMESAKLVRWEFSSGDEVKEGETLLVIETDKVSFEVTAPADGIIHPIASEGSTCEVEETVGYLAVAREEYEQLIKDQPPVLAATPPQVEAVEPGPVPTQPANVSVPAQSKGRIKASPLARFMAAEHGLDLSAITGSGPNGRIVKADILLALEEDMVAPEKRAARLQDSAADSMAKEALESIPIQGLRRVIFDNMYQSLSQSAQLTLHTEACADSIISLRKRISKDGKKISYNAILMKITAAALRLHPKINVSVDGDTIHVWRQIHMGLAMEANDALIVPVVRNPDLKNISEIDHDIVDLIDRTRENKLSPDDLANGTFTLSNLGFADIDFFTPIIRPPESAILGVGRIVEKAIVKCEAVVPEQRIGLSLTFDHRIIDGAPGARFLKTVKEMIEDPVLMIS
jgi:pyruvate dehydrogenase E2 component (dihydrolipoamide acetyltransferase)